MAKKKGTLKIAALVGAAGVFAFFATGAASVRPLSLPVTGNLSAEPNNKRDYD